MSSNAYMNELSIKYTFKITKKKTLTELVVFAVYEYWPIVIGPPCIWKM